jgi:large subunit ribosomal protein L17
MIHRNKGRKLTRTASHRKALMSNLSVSLIKNKKIRTTLAKAKELRTYIEPMINKSKRAFLSKDGKPEFGVHLRREINKYLQDKGAVKTLFDEIGPKVASRNGGYTRVLKMGRRLGDGAELALIELVDYNIEKLKTETPAGDKDSVDKSKTKTKKTKKSSTASKEPKKTASETKKSAKGRKKKEAAE